MKAAFSLAMVASVMVVPFTSEMRKSSTIVIMRASPCSPWNENIAGTPGHGTHPRPLMVSLNVHSHS